MIALDLAKLGVRDGEVVKFSSPLDKLALGEVLVTDERLNLGALDGDIGRVEETETQVFELGIFKGQHFDTCAIHCGLTTLELGVDEGGLRNIDVIEDDVFGEGGVGEGGLFNGNFGEIDFGFKVALVAHDVLHVGLVKVGVALEDAVFEGDALPEGKRKVCVLLEGDICESSILQIGAVEIEGGFLVGESGALKAHVEVVIVGSVSGRSWIDAYLGGILWLLGGYAKDGEGKHEGGSGDKAHVGSG